MSDVNDAYQYLRHQLIFYSNIRKGIFFIWNIHKMYIRIVKCIAWWCNTINMQEHKHINSILVLKKAHLYYKVTAQSTVKVEIEFNKILEPIVIGLHKTRVRLDTIQLKHTNVSSIYSSYDYHLLTIFFLYLVFTNIHFFWSEHIFKNIKEK